MASTHTHETPAFAASRRRSSAVADVDATPQHPVLALQRQLGNATVNRMLAQRAAVAPNKEDDELQAAPAPEPAAPAAAPDELDEEDAAAVQAQRDPAVQRSADRAGGAAQLPEVGPEGGPVSDALAGRIQASRGGGSPLNHGTKAKMEDGFGTAFDAVRVHTDREADALNRSLGAKAFTSGSDVYFRGDAGPADHALLAHELTHVVQQRDMPTGGPMQVGPAGDAHERQADAVAAAVMGGPAAAAAPAAAQRAADER